MPASAQPRSPPASAALAIALAAALALTGCAATTARDLRESALSGHLQFEADDPIEETLGLLGRQAARCLAGEHGVVAQAPGEAEGAWTLTYGFLVHGELVNTVAIDLAPRPEARTLVSISWRPHLLGRWRSYAEKSRRWALRQADDCAF